MKKLWCLFRRRFANGTDKLCVALSETEGRVRTCPYATEEEAKAKCPEGRFLSAMCYDISYISL